MMTEKQPIPRRVALRARLIGLPLVSFGVIVVAMLIFAELADGIGPNDDLHLLDKAIAGALRVEPWSTSRAFFAVVTHLGDGVILAALGCAVGATLLVKRQLLPLYAWILALAGSGLLNVTLKGWFERDRPGDLPLLASWSFPSGHAMNSMVAYGMLAYLLARTVPRRWMPVVVGTAITIVLLVGASRIFLGHHYFSDVLAGFAAGLAWLTVCITATELNRVRLDFLSR